MVNIYFPYESNQRFDFLGGGPPRPPNAPQNPPQPRLSPPTPRPTVTPRPPPLRSPLRPAGIIWGDFSIARTYNFSSLISLLLKIYTHFLLVTVGVPIGAHNTLGSIFSITSRSAMVGGTARTKRKLPYHPRGVDPSYPHDFC